MEPKIMRALIQRVTSSRVCVEGETVGQIERGLLVLLGVQRGDDERDFQFLRDKIPQLRIFEDDQGKMNRSLIDAGGQVLVVSQFTLLADCRKGRRPSFIDAEDPRVANQWCDRFAAAMAEQGIEVASGRFGADMQVELVNDGPVTIWLDSRDAVRR
jgi:D-tyrosyl-tRNA(Tyr) deacylase